MTITETRFTANTYAALSPEWQDFAKRLIERQSKLIDAAEECQDEDQAEAFLTQCEAVWAELDGLSRLLIN